ncbi:MAG: hypothetical protein EOM20_13705 [Spartobacteria bacterium]|nr:hypothetical protein [Spartobacteria bacterium]
MSFLLMIVMLSCAAVLQAILPTLPSMGHTPLPLMPGLVIYYALTRRLATGLKAALFAGFFQDALCMIPLGYSSFCFCICTWLINRVREEVYTRSWITHMLFGALINGGTTCGLFLLLRMSRLLAIPFPQALMKIVGSAILGGIMTPLIFKAVELMERKLGILTVPGDVL